MAHNFVINDPTVTISQVCHQDIIIFTVAPCVLIVLIPLFVQLMHTNYYKIVKQLK